MPGEIIAASVAEAMGLTYAESLAGYTLSSDFVSAIPIAFARQFLVIGLEDSQKDALLVAMGDAAHWQQLQVLARFLNRAVRPMLAAPRAILAAIDEAYQQAPGRPMRLLRRWEITANLPVKA